MALGVDADTETLPINGARLGCDLPRAAPLAGALLLKISRVPPLLAAAALALLVALAYLPTARRDA